MIISYARNFVLLAPWKTASSTIQRRLASLNESPYDRFYAFQPRLNRVVHQHLTCAEFDSLPEARTGLQVASFVRNPYDRVYSGFQQLQRDLAEQPHAAYPAEWVKALVLQQLAENQAQLSKADFDFDRWVLSLTEQQVREVGRNTSFPLHPAHYWTHLDGKQYASFIGRVEQFEQDFDLLCSRLNIQTISRENDNVHHDLATDRTDKTAYRYPARMTRKSIDRINGLFRSDFDIFGFERL